MRIPFISGLSISLLLLTGCSLSPTDPPATYSGATISGTVHGGQQPVIGAYVYLFAANTTGYGSASVSLLNSNVQTNNPGQWGQDSNNNYYVITGANGAFTISDDYSCTAGQQVYLYAIGGNPGVGATNPSASFLSVLGNCPGPSFSSSEILSVNEATTVAAAFAFAGFSTDATHVSSSGTPLAVQGVANAFANAENLTDLTSGMAQLSILSGHGTAPQQTVNTLADILASCVNSTGAVTGPTNPTACYTLFYNAQTNGSSGGVPTDTATAAINIAHNPGANIAALFGTTAPTTPFSPALASAPNDFTLGLQLTGGGLDVPYNIAIDGYGDAWLTNDAPNLTEFGPSGAPKSPSTGGYSGIGGYTNSTYLKSGYQLAIDTSNNVWISEVNYDLIGEFSNSGTAITAINTTSTYTVPGYIAIDPSGNVWVTNSTNSTILEIPFGTTTFTPFTGGGLNSPYGIASDSSGNIWIANNGTGTVSEFNNAGTPNPLSPFATGGTYGAYSYPRGGIAVGHSGKFDDIWVAGAGSVDAVTILDDTGTNIFTGSTPAAGGMNNPSSMAIDGAGNAWVANASTGAFTVSEFNSVGTPITTALGYGYGSIYHFGAAGGPEGVAIDGSGNVWIANTYGASSGGDVVELIGAGAPTVTPIAAAVKTGYVGKLP